MLSIVVPVFNEEESIHAFYEELLRVVVALDKEYELIIVDDGSTDSSLEILKNIAKKISWSEFFLSVKTRERQRL